MKRGFGTNFHNVYSNNAEMYNKFSTAEVFSKQLLSELKKSIKGNILLDLACGTAQKTNIFSKYFTKVYALDKSKELLNFARNKYLENEKISYILSSADTIPLLDNSIDSVIITWGSFPLNKTLKEINRVLKPGGIVLRIGAHGADEFTLLFPQFDIKRINRIKKVFSKNNYTSQKNIVNIKFKDIKEAKIILSSILGVDQGKIIKSNYIHEVVLNKYSKPII